MRTVLAGDLGGTKCRFALVAEDFARHESPPVATVRERSAFLAAFDAAIAELLRTAPKGWQAPLAAGFGTAGVIPVGGASIHHAPNLPLDGYPLADHVRSRFGLPTVLLNDGRASALGEFQRGAAAGADPLLCLFFGTGIGIGMVVGGRPYTGADNAAGEIGHTIFRPGGRRCPCGGLGHFEAYCGGRAIVERAAAEIAPTAPGGGPWHVGALAALAGAADRPGAAVAAGILDDAALAAGVLTANACTLLNPRACVLGGGVLQGWPELAVRVAAFVVAETSAPIHTALRFTAALEGSAAILYGAAAATGVLWTPPA